LSLKLKTLTRFIKSEILLWGIFSWISGHAATWQTDTLLITSADSVVFLSKTFIIPATLTVINVNGDTIPVGAFNIDALNGKIVYPNAPSDTLIAHYCYLDVELPRTQILNPPPRVYLPENNHDRNSTPDKEQPTPASGTDYDFLKSGTIYRGVNLGSNTGLSLQSGLNLELSGQVTEDISIVGSLTDQNIPIQPEGNTQTLDEIDKVYIQVQMPHEQITFGDYEYSSLSQGLSAYHRKLQGVLLESDRQFNQTRLSGAVTKGQFTTNYFIGEESNQGPYQLVGREGETAIIVLAGTEKVWINGEPLKRGENNDYVIDYSTGEITFTAYRMITSNSRITVDFQYSNLIYQKNIWIAQNSTELNQGKIRLSAGYINESDDKNNPIELVLTKDDQAQLKMIGDDEQSAFQSTIKADTSGAYQFIDSILVFVGAGLGDYSASFYNVGKKGTYKKEYNAETAYFVYIDKSDPSTSADDLEQAVYLPVKPLKLPRNQRLYHIAWEWNPSQNISLSSEVAGSDLDRNTFSTQDDGDNRDIAVDLQSNINIPLSPWMKTGIQLRLRQIGERFEPMDRFQEVEYRRKWDLPSDSLQGEKVMEGTITFDLKDVSKLSLDLGSYNRLATNADRYKINGIVHYKLIDQLELSQEQIQCSQIAAYSSDWIRRKLFLRFKLLNFHPYTQFYQEKRTGDSTFVDNFQFNEQHYGIESNNESKLTGRIETYFRDDYELLENQWSKSSEDQNLSFSGQLNEWRSLFSRFTYTYRKRKYLGENPASDQQSQLMDINVRQNPRHLPLTWEGSLKVEEERTVKKEYRYYYVGKGEGQYLYDSTFADYVLHPQGDYILRILPSEIKEPVTSIQNGLRVQLNGRQLKGKIPWEFPTRLSTLTDVRFQQQIKNEEKPLQIISFSGDRVDDRWAYFNRTLQQDVNYRAERSRADIRLRYVSDLQISQLDVRGREKSSGDETSLRYKGPFFHGIILDYELARKMIYRKSDFNYLRDRDISSYQTEGTFSYLLNAIHLFEMEITSAYEKEETSDIIETLLLGIRNSYERKLKNKGRGRGFIEIDRVSVTPVGSPIPWEMCDGKKEGLTLGWGLSVEYRLGKNLSLRCNYEGWNEPDRDVYHLGSAEVRALF
jgi:hypothetical protein